LNSIPRTEKKMNKTNFIVCAKVVSAMEKNTTGNGVREAMGQKWRY
jgi:hypothetical protein